MEVLKSTLLAKLLLGCLLAQAPFALAHLPELFGREYIRLTGPTHGLVDEPAANQSSVPSERDRLLHEKLLDDAERSGGPYATGLADPLISLGRYHQMREEFDDAIEAYRRALHLVRVNDGLSSTRQVPILREMLKIYRAVGDHRSLGDIYQYYYRVSKLGEPPRTQEQLDVSLEYLNWERQLYASRADGYERAHLLRAYRANESMLESLVPTSDRELDWYIRLSMSQIRNLYLILGEDPLPWEALSAKTGKGAAADAVYRELAFVQLTALSRGRKLLEACIERAQASPPATLAALHLELGDWHQWNDRLGPASKQYERVVEVLRAAGEEQLLQRWLDQPVELPDETDLWSIYRDVDLSAQVVVEARYDVSSRGDVRRIEVSVADEEQSWQAWRIKRMLRDTHFRPRFSQGQPEAVEQVSRRYMLTGSH